MLPSIHNGYTVPQVPNVTHSVYISSPVFSSILYQMGSKLASQNGTSKILRDIVPVPESEHGSCPRIARKFIIKITVYVLHASKALSGFTNIKHSQI